LSIRADLVECQKAFIRANDGKEPTKIYLTRADERALTMMPRDEAGGTTPANIRTLLTHVLGMTPIWDAPHRRCE